MCKGCLGTLCKRCPGTKQRSDTPGNRTHETNAPRSGARIFQTDPLAMRFLQATLISERGVARLRSKRSTYIHGTEPAEQQRLALLNRLTNAAFVEFLNVQPGMRVLEVGSGLGYLAAAVARSAKDVRVVGIERSEDQIRAAVKD